MVDLNKLKELKEALTEELITQEEYEKLKENIINEPKPNLPSLLADKLNKNTDKNNNSSVQTIPTDGLQHIIINNNNNNNNNNNPNNNPSGCYQNTALHLILSIFTGGGWLIVWIFLALLKI